MRNHAKGSPVIWTGENNRTWRAVVGIEDNTPVIFSIDYLRDNGWVNLASGLTPDFEVTTGIRKMDDKLGSKPEWRWYTYNDLPMERTDELEVAKAEFNTQTYEITQNGLRTEVTFDGITMGYFKGNFRITVYEGSDLLRVEVLASNDQPSFPE